MIELNSRYIEEIMPMAVYNQKELEYIFGISEPSISKIVSSGTLPFVLLGKRKRFLGESLIKFIKNYPHHKSKTAC